MRLSWDAVGERTYETGVDHGVLYPQKGGSYPKGYAWNGLTNVTETPSGAEDSPLYADNIKYLNLKSAEEFGGTIECYTYPDEFAQCNGEAEAAGVPGVTFGQQKRNTFGFAYRTKVGNDSDGEDHAYKIHLWYGCSATPSERAYQTVNDSPEAITFSYEIATTPIAVKAKDADGNTLKPVALLVIDSRRVSKEKMTALEDLLYGNDSDGDAKLPMPDEIIELLKDE